jgi:plastocyanin
MSELSARRRIAVAAAVVSIVVIVPSANALDAGPGVACEPVNGHDRSTALFEPNVLIPLSVWLSADSGPDQVGVHAEPYARQAWFADAGVGTDGSGNVAAAFPGGDGVGPSYGAAEASTDGSACAGSEMADAGASSEGSPPGLVVAGPGSGFTTYATPVAVVTAGAEAQFVNADVADHDVIADDVVDGEPAFRTALIGTGETAAIEGVAQLAPGSYTFYCSLHRTMTGTLTVVDAEGGTP